MSEPDSADVQRAAAMTHKLLASNISRDWSVRAGQLNWTVNQVVAHLADVCGFYAVHLALRSPRRLRFDVAVHQNATEAERAETMAALAEHLAQVIKASPPDARAWHHHGMADPAGFAAMACDELLVHGHDMAEGFGDGFEPDRRLCARILARLFPWAPRSVDPWKALRWANGRTALPGHPRLPADWAWLSAPLSEWDGQRPVSREPPDRYSWDPATQRWERPH